MFKKTIPAMNLTQYFTLPLGKKIFIHNKKLAADYHEV